MPQHGVQVATVLATVLTNSTALGPLVLVLVLVVVLRSSGASAGAVRTTGVGTSRVLSLLVLVVALLCRMPMPVIVPPPAVGPVPRFAWPLLRALHHLRNAACPR